MHRPLHAKLAPLARRPLLAAGVVGGLIACGPIIRPADFPGAETKVTGASLLGPFDGQVTDAGTGEPITDATVVGVWSFDRGRGHVGPAGSRTVEVTTDALGRYRIPALRPQLGDRGKRLVAFHLLVYKRGYVAFRSDMEFGRGPRRDFVARHHTVGLVKWSGRDPHADHVEFLAAPPAIKLASSWELPLANADLYRRRGGTALIAGLDDDADPDPDRARPAALTPLWLEASELLSADDVALRTGSSAPLIRAELDDLERTSYYHGVSLIVEQGSGRDDVTWRVWLEPPDGLEGVVESIEATLPGIEPSSELGPETWVAELDELYAVAFVDRERKLAMILTCGRDQCADPETAIILARLLRTRADRLRKIPARGHAGRGRELGPRVDPAAPEPGGPEGLDAEDGLEDLDDPEAQRLPPPPVQRRRPGRLR